jgi:SAM-dependent methyltransferase
MTLDSEDLPDRLENRPRSERSAYRYLRRLLERFYFFCQRLLVPGLKDSQYLYADKLLSIVDRRSRWLDVGCGHRIVPAWMKFDETTLSRRAAFFVGVDRDAESLRRHKNLHARVIADFDALPFREGAFSLITANMVVEHLSNPHKNLTEVANILRPGGLFVFHTVNILHYNAWISSLLPNSLKLWLVKFFEDRKAEDVYPTHYRLNTLGSIEVAACKASLDVLGIDMVNSSPETIMLGPIVLLELLLIRLLNRSKFATRRSNVIATLRRPTAKGTLETEATVPACTAGLMSPNRKTFTNASRA